MYREKSESDLIKIFVENILTTNRGYNFYVNWNNALAFKEYEIELHAMDVLIKNKDFDNSFITLLQKLPTVINTFPLLFALSKIEREELWKNKKELEIASSISKTSENFNFSKLNSSKPLSITEIKKYLTFFEEMGLKNLFLNIIEKSVTDYVIGVLVGLDTNGRKNRSGQAFELLCEQTLIPLCQKYKIQLIQQKQFKHLEKYGFKINQDISERKADFILIKDEKALNIESNYYYSAGSKPEEIVDSYINRKNDLRSNGIEFVLLTDGLCWDNEYKNQLNKAFRHITIMNYFMANSGYIDELLKEIFE